MLGKFFQVQHNIGKFLIRVLINQTFLFLRRLKHFAALVTVTMDHAYFLWSIQGRLTLPAVGP